MRKLIAALELLRSRIFGWLCSLDMRIRLALRGAAVGRYLRVYGRPNLYVHSTAKVMIGSNCRFKSRGFYENAVGGAVRMGIWVGRNASLTIGDSVGISGSTIVCTQEVVIGEGAYIGGDCKIYDTDFHPLRPEQRAQWREHRGERSRIEIGARAFVGAHSIVLKGVTIGEGAVIGAGSIVTKDVPAGEIWAGNPARRVAALAEAAQS